MRVRRQVKFWSGELWFWGNSWGRSDFLKVLFIGLWGNLAMDVYLRGTAQ